MSIRRFYVEKSDIIDGVAYIKDQENNHLQNVLRLKNDTEIIIVCGDEYDYYARIIETTKNTTKALITNKLLNEKNPITNITVFQALTKKDAMSNLVVRLNEIGISEFVPVTTRYVVSKDTNFKKEKLQLQSNLSLKQCERSIPIIVKDTIDISKIEKATESFDVVFFANEREKVSTINKYLKNIDYSKKIGVIVGCEGGFSPQENEMLMGFKNVKSVSLGKRILRVETATLSIASILINDLENKMF